MSAALYIIADSITITRTFVYRNFVDRMCPPVSLAKNHIRAAMRVVTMTLVTRDRMNTEPFHFSRVYTGVSITGGRGNEWVAHVVESTVYCFGVCEYVRLTKTTDCGLR